MRKREPQTVKLNLAEQRIVRRAAQLDGVAPATFSRLAIVRAAKRRVRRHQAERVVALAQ